MDAMVKKKHPKVSIGLPVYNGENYLSEAIESLLNQTFTDFELIISDNGSTDSTQSICKAFAEADDRVRYFRYEQNRGAAWNYNHVFALAQGEYFKWAAHDDRCKPDFLRHCVAILDQHAEVVLCHPRTRIIDEHGQPIEDYSVHLATDSPHTNRRLYELICRKHGCYAVFGLIRRHILQKTPLIGSYVASDRVLLAALALHGPFYELPGFLFLRRDHPHTSDRAFKDRRRRAAWFDPQMSGRISLPQWRLLLEYKRAIQSPDLSFDDRVRCYWTLLRWCQQSWKGLLVDLRRGFVWQLANLRRS
ncbi:MAG: glycosyltransferase family 2 protein [Chloroflexota bacterium]